MKSVLFFFWLKRHQPTTLQPRYSEQNSFHLIMMYIIKEKCMLNLKWEKGCEWLNFLSIHPFNKTSFVTLTQIHKWINWYYSNAPVPAHRQTVGTQRNKRSPKNQRKLIRWSTNKSPEIQELWFLDKDSDLRCLSRPLWEHNILVKETGAHDASRFQDYDYGSPVIVRPSLRHDCCMANA